MTRHSEEHINRVTEPRFSKQMRKAFPMLRGFNEKLRQGKQVIRPARFEEVEARRELRKGPRNRRHGRPRGRKPAAR